MIMYSPWHSAKKNKHGSTVMLETKELQEKAIRVEHRVQHALSQLLLLYQHELLSPCIDIDMYEGAVNSQTNASFNGDKNKNKNDLHVTKQILYDMVFYANRE